MEDAEGSISRLSHADTDIVTSVKAMDHPGQDLLCMATIKCGDIKIWDLRSLRLTAKLSDLHGLVHSMGNPMQ